MCTSVLITKCKRNSLNLSKTYYIITNYYCTMLETENELINSGKLAQTFIVIQRIMGCIKQYIHTHTHKQAQLKNIRYEFKLMNIMNFWENIVDDVGFGGNEEESNIFS